MKHPRKFLAVVLFIAAACLVSVQPVFGQEAVVRAVLFYSPTCPHCEQVIQDVIPPLVDQYGTRLQIFGINTYSESGSQLFQSAVQSYEIPREQQGVPLMIIDDHVLVGSNQIPQQLPGIIQEGMEDGGLDWPDIPGLTEEMERVDLEADPTTQQDAESSLNIDQDRTLRETFAADPAGNTLSVIILAGMVITLVSSGIQLTQATPTTPRSTYWIVPVLSLIGLGVALYLSYVEVTHTEAVCGPVGKCNTVQQSPYATLFGFLPVGVLGTVGYVFILVLWLLKEAGPASWTRFIHFGLWAASLFGILFSIYLTFLEPFVIGASCLWCLTSAVIMTILFFQTTREMKAGTQTVPQEPYA